MDIKMGKLGESVDEGRIEEWVVCVGEDVDEYDGVCEVIRDKVRGEVGCRV